VYDSLKLLVATQGSSFVCAMQTKVIIIHLLWGGLLSGAFLGGLRFPICGRLNSDFYLF